MPQFRSKMDNNIKPYSLNRLDPFMITQFLTHKSKLIKKPSPFEQTTGKHVTVSKLCKEKLKMARSNVFRSQL